MLKHILALALILGLAGSPAVAQQTPVPDPKMPPMPSMETPDQGEMAKPAGAAKSDAAKSGATKSDAARSGAAKSGATKSGATKSGAASEAAKTSQATNKKASEAKAPVKQVRKPAKAGPAARKAPTPRRGKPVAKPAAKRATQPGARRPAKRPAKILARPGRKRR